MRAATCRRASIKRPLRRQYPVRRGWKRVVDDRGLHPGVEGAVVRVKENMAGAPSTPPEAGRGGRTWAYARGVRHLSRAASLVWEVETSLDSSSRPDPPAVPHAFARQLPLARHGEASRRTRARFSPACQRGQSHASHPLANAANLSRTRQHLCSLTRRYSGGFGTSHGVQPSYPSGGSVGTWYELLLKTLTA